MSSQTPPRTRIVVPIGEQTEQSDNPHAPNDALNNSPRKPKTRRVWRALGMFAAVVGIVAILAGVAGLFWWRSYQRSPAYSLALIVDAAQRNDRETFDRLVDIDQIAQNLAPQVAQQGFGRFGELPESLQRQIMNTLPQVLPTVRDSIALELQRTLAEISPNARIPVNALALLIPRIITINEQGDAANAQISMGNRVTQLDLKRNQDRWRVTGITDEQLAAYIASQIGKATPTSTTPNIAPLNLAPRR